MAHKKLHNLEKRNILFILIHFLRKKYSKPLLWLLFYWTNKEQVNAKIAKYKKDHVGFNHGFNSGEKKLSPKSFKEHFVILTSSNEDAL